MDMKGFKVGLMAAAIVLAMPVLAADPAPTLYTLQLWAAPGGQGLARTIGPMTPEHCRRNLEILRGNQYEDIPPSMQLVALQCATQAGLQGWLLAYNCQASGSNPVPEHPDYRLWLYSCFML
jgi:hypothetical protein